MKTLDMKITDRHISTTRDAFNKKCTENIVKGVIKYFIHDQSTFDLIRIRNYIWDTITIVK